ncbi:MAG: class I SAM-dependent methyltransferase [Bacteroidia bacterium]|nr:class I SAM-dependent methyltransferase [Bacteroidia bacterium]
MKDYTLSDETFEVLKCDNCGGRFTQNIPVESEIGKYYQSEEYISHTDTSKGLVNSLYQIVRNYTLGTKRKLVEKSSKKDKGSILDIGCGTGDFLKAMKDSGWETLGLEPDDRARKVALSKNGIKSEFSTHLFEIQAASFDVVSMWHVLEHVHELHKYLDTIFKILKDDGVLIIAVPNYQSSDAHHYKDKWAAYDVPRHLYHFSPESMDKLLDSHDFQIFSEKHMPFDSFYVSMLSEKYKTGSTRLVPAFMNGAKSFVNALNKPEKCSSVLYLARKK